MRYLVEHGADPNLEIPAKRGAWPRTMLSRVALYLTPDSLIFFLENGARPDSSALHMIIRRQSSQVQFDYDERSWYAPLTSEERIAMVKLLISHGLDPNLEEDGLRCRATSCALQEPSLTPLQLAQEFGDVEVSALLVQAGARAF